MAKHQGAMGRNPFGKRVSDIPKNVKEVKVEKIENPPRLERLTPRLADWLLVDLPAEYYVLGLKTMLLTRDVFDKAIS